MRSIALKWLRLVLFIVLLWTSCSQVPRKSRKDDEPSSRTDNNQDHSPKAQTQSTNRLLPTFSNYRPKYSPVLSSHNGVDIGLDDEAFLFKVAISGSSEVLKSSLRLLARGVRSSGDTFAGLISSAIKAMGGVFNLLADALSEVSLPLVRPRGPHAPMPHILDHAGRRVGRCLKWCSNALFIIGESCILAGETAEMVTGSLGQSIEDSFIGLEIVVESIQKGAKQLLLPVRRVLLPSGEYVWQQPRTGESVQNATNATESIAAGNAHPNPYTGTPYTGTPTTGTPYTGTPYTGSSPTIASPEVESMSDSIDHAGSAAHKAQSDAAECAHHGTDEAGRQGIAQSCIHFDPAPPGIGIKLAKPISSPATPFAIKNALDSWVRALLSLSQIGTPTPHPSSSPSPIPEKHEDSSIDNIDANFVPESSALVYLYYAFSAWILEPFSFQSAAGLAPPSISIHVFAVMLAIACMSSFTYSLKRRRFLVLLCCCLLGWVYLMAMDTVIRKKIEHRVAQRAIGSYLRDHIDQHERAKKLYGTTDALSVLRRALSSSTKFYEGSVWVNVLLSTLWNLDGYPHKTWDGKGYNAPPKDASWQHGGLGPYISEMWEQLLNEQLSLVPAGVTNLQLKRFSLGTMAPLIKAVKFDSDRDAICFSPLPPSSSISSFLQNQWSSFHQQHYGSPPVHRPAFAAACQHLIADVDFAYLSQDMDIVFSLRSTDVKSMLPEATVKLSEISLSGTVRIDAELTPDYPFVGNATVSFLSLPILDCTISSFGGVDLASIPGVYTWINITMTWLLSQYTAPKYGTFDLRHNICPACDGKTAPSTTEAILEAAEALGKGLKESLDSAWRFLKTIRRKRIYLLPPLPDQVRNDIPPSSSVPKVSSATTIDESSQNARDSTQSSPPLAALFSKLMLESQWSNGTMGLMVTTILWLSFRLLRKA